MDQFGINQMWNPSSFILFKFRAASKFRLKKHHRHSNCSWYLIFLRAWKLFIRQWLCYVLSCFFLIGFLCNIQTSRLIKDYLLHICFKSIWRTNLKKNVTMRSGAYLGDGNRQYVIKFTIYYDVINNRLLGYIWA